MTATLTNIQTLKTAALAEYEALCWRCTEDASLMRDSQSCGPILYAAEVSLEQFVSDVAACKSASSLLFQRLNCSSVPKLQKPPCWLNASVWQTKSPNCKQRMKQNLSHSTIALPSSGKRKLLLNRRCSIRLKTRQRSCARSSRSK